MGRAWASWGATLSLLFLASCAVLTADQVGEVERFAKSAGEYGELPGQVISAYGAVRLNSAILGAVVAAQRSSAGSLLQDVKSSREHARLSREATAAIGAIDVYAELLQKLTSEEFSDAVDKEAQSLGESFDKLAKEAGVGDSAIAQIVSGGVSLAGRVWIRHKQAEFIKSFVTRADPIIAELAAKIKGAMASYTTGGLLDGEEKTVTTNLENVIAMTRGSGVPLEVLQLATQTENQILATRDLADRVTKSADSIREAHHRLMTEVQSRRTLRRTIAEIRVLADEVKAARKVAQELDG